MNKGLKKPSKIAVFRALQLGDLLCSVPAFESLRHAFPDANITLIGLPWAESFVNRYSMYFDKFISFPGFPGLPEQPFDAEAWLRFKQQVQEENFDLILQMQGNGSVVNEMLMQLNPVQLAGFHLPENGLDSPLFIEYPNDLNEIDRHLALLQYLGIPAVTRKISFPLSEEDYKETNDLLLPVTTGQYVCLHPGSRDSKRQWNPAFFAALADYCVEQGFSVIITGVASESEIAKEVAKCMKHVPIDITGRTKLGAAAVLIKNAALLIANCTGVSHIAAAMETPSVIISMNGEPERWQPLNSGLHTYIDWLTNLHFEKILLATAEKITQLKAKKELSRIS